MGRAAAAVLILASLLQARLVAETRTEALARRVLEEDFLDGKRSAANALASMKDKAAVSALEGLLAEDDAWTSAAAFEALLRVADPRVDEILVARYAGDSFLRSLSAQAFRSHAERLIKAIEKRYRSDDAESGREALIEMAGISAGPDAASFLASIAEDPASGNREDAFAAYASMRRTGDRELMRRLQADAELAPLAVARLAEIGGPEDLPVFERAFAAGNRTELRISAMRGIARFADGKRRQAVFLEAMRSGETAFAEASISMFGSERSPVLMAEAARHAAGGDPFLALRAAGYVASYDLPEALPLAIPGLRAEYAENRARRGFFDWFANFITLGLSGVMDDYRSIRNRREFDAEKERLARRLSAIAGIEIGPDYAAWEEQAALSGWCVGEASILQYLLAADAGKRAKARRAGARLLGAADEAALAASIPGYAALDDIGKGLAIASRLKARGYPKLWK